MRDSCKVCWRLGYLPGLGLAIGPCPHPPRLSQAHSGTLRGTHGHANTNPQTHHRPHGAITRPSRLSPVSLNVLFLGHRSLSPSQPQMSPQILSPSGSLISLSPPKISVAVSVSLHFFPLWLDFHASATWTPCLSDSVLLCLWFLVSLPTFISPQHSPPCRCPPMCLTWCLFPKNFVPLPASAPSLWPQSPRPKSSTVGPHLLNITGLEVRILCIPACCLHGFLCVTICMMVFVGLG